MPCPSERFSVKLTATEGKHPIFTDYVSTYYCGSYIIGTEFDGNFDGYVATDTNFDGAMKLPAVYDTPLTGQVSNYISGWIAALQYMREGERWLLYVPYQSGYGAKPGTTSTIMHHSMLFFDIILDEVVG